MTDEALVERNRHRAGPDRAVNDTVEATRTAWSQGRVNTDQAVLIASTVTSLGVGVDMVARADAADGIPEIVPPPRIDPHRTPIRHQRLKPRAG